MVGSATLTTVPSRNATPEPSTVASSTQRPAVVPNRTPSTGGAAAELPTPGWAAAARPSAPGVTRRRCAGPPAAASGPAHRRRVTPGADGRAAAANPGGGSLAAAAPADGVRFGTTAGRWVLLATVLGSGVAFLDGTVVNVALPTIGRDLRTGFATLQWVLDAYLLTLGSFVLVGGGRR